MFCLQLWGTTGNAGHSLLETELRCWLTDTPSFEWRPRMEPPPEMKRGNYRRLAVMRRWWSLRRYLNNNAFIFVFSLKALRKSLNKHLQRCKRPVRLQMTWVNVRDCRSANGTLDAAYRLYIGNGIDAIPDEMFRIKPFPLWKDSKCLRV